MITDRSEAVDAYFAKSYDQLKRYASKIITDRKRTYSAEEIVNEAYEYLSKKEDLRVGEIDQFCKRWISRTICLDRSFANLKMSIKLDLSEDSAADLSEELEEGRTSQEVFKIMRGMEEADKTAIRALLKWNDVDKAAKSICMNRKNYSKLVRRIINEHFN